MIFAVPKETESEEPRVAATPTSVAKLVKKGAQVSIEAGLGNEAGFPDAAYEKSGATLVASRQELLGQADVILRLRKPPAEEVEWLKPDAIHLSFLDPFNEKELMSKLANKGVTAVSMEMIPRITRAQKMDALTSQANLGGYAAVIQGAALMKKVFPMMSTAAGTILPARVFVIGAGVAGLQAIATAGRLGAKVEAFDTRPVVAEQVRSLGAKFVEIDLGGESGQTEQGYAKELTPEQVERQREGMKKCCAEADLVITTAQVFGRKAPRIVTKDMLQAMKPQSVIVDMAVATGGNVEGSVSGETVEVEGVRIYGNPNLPGCVPLNASEVYANNLLGLIEDYWDKEGSTLTLDPADELLKHCVLTHKGAICHPDFKDPE
ncbi:MAG: Re/Si-specific NAD(P)(+) transhydrogenase subunit alpha [Opitutales bacterium]